jgi:hypothetical protein
MLLPQNTDMGIDVDGMCLSLSIVQLYFQSISPHHTANWPLTTSAFIHIHISKHRYLAKENSFPVLHCGEEHIMFFSSTSPLVCGAILGFVCLLVFLCLGKNTFNQINF